MNIIIDTNLMLTIALGVLLANFAKHLIVFGMAQLFGYGTKTFSSSKSGSGSGGSSIKPVKAS